LQHQSLTIKTNKIMGAFKVETCYGDVMVRNVYDYDTGESYYEAYEPTTDDECDYGKYIGEFHSDYDYDDNDERSLFVDDLEDMLDDNDYYGVSSEPTPYTRQVDIINKLEKLVHNRFSIESLEKKLSEIFGGEEIHIELGYIDVEDETAPDWNYMFTSEQDVIGGDFDIYVLMHRNKDCNGNTMYVTEVSYEFFERAY
jgi:hypothetical protein